MRPHIENHATAAPSRRARPIRGARLGAALAVLALACLAGVSTAASAQTSPTVRLIAASSTDPAIDDVIGVHHVALGPAETRTGRLLLFLPGTTASPQQYSQLIERSAELGHHAIGLAYVNALAVNALCAGAGGTDCHERVRREILFGSDETDLVDVDLPNSVFHRLDALLAHLETIAPDEDWAAFRDSSGGVRWSRVIVSGQSQGAGHAAFIGRLHRVARAVLFSGTEPALWTSAGDFATPADDYYGLVHRLEPIYVPIQLSWDQIGIPGVLVFVEASPPPYGGSHQLASIRQDCAGDPQSNGFYHNCTSVDDWMPLEPDGTSVFEPVWDHLFALDASPVPLAGAPARLLLLGAMAAVGAWRLRGAARTRAAPPSAGRAR